MNIELTNEQKAYFTEIAAQLVATHGDKAAEALAADPVAAVAAAHEQRCKFIVEMLENRTDRSQMARKVLCASVYGTAVARAAAEAAIEQCGYIADHSWRRANGMG